MSDYFVFDGVDSRTFDAVVYERNTYSSPDRQFTTVAIPGRSGDYLMDGRRFGNVAHEYDVIIYRRFDENFTALKAHLMSRAGYCVLTDSFHPNEFFHAYYSEGITPEVTRNGDMGKFVLRFSRKPQRWLLSGQDEIIIRTNSTTQRTSVINPTKFNCYPLLMFRGTSLRDGFKVTVNGTQIELTAWDSSTNNYPNSTYLNSSTRWLNVDFNTVQAWALMGSGGTAKYYYNTAMKYSISDSKTAFQMKPGTNYLSMNSVGNVSEIKMIPRWYTI